MDDKLTVIICVTIIALACLVAGYFKAITGPDQIVGNIVSGLFGVAMGRAWTKSLGEPKPPKPNTSKNT